MRVIMLSGPEDTRKTTTMKMLFEKLAGSEKQNIFIPVIYKPKRGDFECIVKFQGKRIALFSHGDVPKNITRYIDIYEEIGCDILVCTCRDSHVKLKRKHYIEVKAYIEKYVDKDDFIFKSEAINKEDEEEEKRQKNEKDVIKIIERIQIRIQES